MINNIEDNFYCLTENLDDLNIFYWTLINKPINFIYYIEATDIDLKNLIKEAKSGNSFLTVNKNTMVLYRNINIINLYVYFNNSSNPIRELLKIELDGSFNLKMNNNYVVRKSKEQNILNNFLGEVENILSKNIIIYDKNYKMNFNSVNIFDKTILKEYSKFKFLETTYHIYTREIILQRSFHEIRRKFILYTDDNICIFITPEYNENNTLKNLTIWYLSDNQNCEEYIDFINQYININNYIELFKDNIGYSLFDNVYESNEFRDSIFS